MSLANEPSAASGQRPRTRQTRWLPRGAIAVAAAVCIFLLTVSAPAQAYWTGAGTGVGTSTTATLVAPLGVMVPATSGSSVPVSWTASTGALVPLGYYVTRVTGTRELPACGSSALALLTGTSCTDSLVGDGSYSYRVTAVYDSWRATSEASGSVTVTTATQLVFTSQPTDSASGAVISPSIRVAVQSAAGAPVPTAGIAITVGISTNPSAGTLSGTTTVSTDATGVAGFDDLALDNAGVGYILSATGAGLASATSAPFTVAGGPSLGSAARYSVLGGIGVVSTGVSAISGDLGVSPSAAVTGFPPGTVGGTIHVADADAAAAQTAVAASYAEAAARTAGSQFSGDQNGVTFFAGVHHTAAAFALTGSLTLDGQGDPNAVFVIQVDAALNTAAGSQLLLINGAKASNLFWQVNGAAGIGAAATFSGTILAAGSITIGAGSQLIGRAFSPATVTLADNTIRFTVALPPTIAITGGATATTKVATPVIAGTSDAAAGRTVTVTIAAQALTTTVGVDHGWSVTAGALAAGVYPVVASVRDAAGNAATFSQQLTVELNPAVVDLGSTNTYSVLAGTGVVGNGTSTLSGDLGVTPSSSITGFPPGTVGGVIHAADSNASAAQSARAAAYADAASRTADSEFSGDQNGATFHAGVHHTAAAFALTGILTLDGENNPDAVFIIRVDAALNTAAGSTVLLINGATATNVFWQVAGAAGTGATSYFAGTILASGAITVGAGGQLIGRALTTGTVTLTDNAIRFTP